MISRSLDCMEKGLNRVTGFAGGLACLCMVLTVSLVFINVLARYTFSTGAVWAQELEWYLMSVVALFGIAYCMRYDDHVRVDIFYRKYSEVRRMWFDALVALFVVIPCALLIGYYGWSFAEISYLRGERSPNSTGLPWRFIPKAFIVVGFAFVALEGLRQLIVQGRSLHAHYSGKGDSNAA